MTKIILSFTALLVVVLAIIFYQNFTTPTVKINGHEFQLVIAKTEQEKQIGLSKTNTLPQNKAMVFEFDKEGIYPFWMKDMKFPIDIIFIRGNKIVTIYKNVAKPNDSQNLQIYSPTETSNKVIETNAGLSGKYNFKVGDMVEFRNL